MLEYESADADWANEETDEYAIWADSEDEGEDKAIEWIGPDIKTGVEEALASVCEKPPRTPEEDPLDWKAPDYDRVRSSCWLLAERLARTGEERDRLRSLRTNDHSLPAIVGETLAVCREMCRFVSIRAGKIWHDGQAIDPPANECIAHRYYQGLVVQSFTDLMALAGHQFHRFRRAGNCPRSVPLLVD